MEQPQDVHETCGKLCPTCSVVPFNDELVASYVAASDIRGPYFDTEATAAKYRLDYKVVDSLPNLPWLEQSALRGCDLCSLLRLEIMRAEFDYNGFVEINLAYHLGDEDFPGLGLAALVAEMVWRPDIPSSPPASSEPDILRDCIIFTLESDDADVASWLKIPRLRKEDPLCKENIQFMRDALDDCVVNCNHFKATGFLPSRLLDLGPQSNIDSIRLIDTTLTGPKNGDEIPRYAALSYCWGPSLASDSIQQIRTKVGSLESMKLQIPLKALPQAILDAVKVCRSLSIQYLWVDALCIIQDDISDWERESASMTLIYKNAFVTICAPPSNASNESFLVRNRRHLKLPFHSRVVPGINGHYNLVASGTCRDRVLFGWPDLDIDDTSWKCRGWTLQEYEMSNRLLVFGEFMVHFQCRDNISENGYHQKPTSRFDRMIGALDDANSNSGSARSRWGNILSAYGSRNLTFREDRLPGISGMAKYIADKYDDEYLVGLWRSQLPSSLVWHAWSYEKTEYHVELQDLLNKLRAPTPYIAPSWSPLRLNTRFEPGLRTGSYYQPSAESTVVDTRVQSVGENPFGRVQHGQIRIRARLTAVLSDLAKLPCFQIRPYIWYTLDKGVITYYNFDWFPKGSSYNRGDLSMLLISSTEASTSWHTGIHGLESSRRTSLDCLTNELPPHAGGAQSSSETRFAGSETQADQDGDQDSNQAEEESGSLLSRKFAIAPGSPKDANTEVHTQNADYSMHPDFDGEYRLDESKSDPGESRAGSEDGPRSPRIHNRDAFGILVHPLSGTDSYVRVGVWASLAEDGGGTARFENLDEREIDIV